MRTLNELFTLYKSNVKRASPDYKLHSEAEYIFYTGAAYVMNEIQNSKFITDALDASLIDMLPPLDLQ